MSSESKIDKDEKAEGKTAKTREEILGKEFKAAKKGITDNITREVYDHYGKFVYPPGGGKPYYVSFENECIRFVVVTFAVCALFFLFVAP